MLRITEKVLKERPNSSKEVLAVINDVARKNLKCLAEEKGWLCEECAFLSSPEVEAEHEQVSEVGTTATVPTSEVGSEIGEVEGEPPLEDVVTTASTSAVAKAAPSRFGDGVDVTRLQEKVPEKPVLLPPDYKPPARAWSRDGKKVLHDLETWEDAKGCKVWV